MFFAVPTTVQATCKASSSCKSGQVACRLNGSTTNYCCKTAAECTTFKNSGGTSKSGSFPQTCTNGGAGIETALGCLPYETDGFTSSLLLFLAGISGGITLIVMLMATIQIMTGGNNPEQVKKGKELFTGAVTGLLFIIFSVTLLKIVAGDIIKLPGF